MQARVNLEEKNFAGAVKLYDQAIALAPWWSSSHFDRALVIGQITLITQTGPVHFEEAIASMKRFLVLAPNSDNAREGQDKIYEWELKLERERRAAAAAAAQSQAKAASAMLKQPDARRGNGGWNAPPNSGRFLLVTISAPIANQRRSMRRAGVASLVSGLLMLTGCSEGSRLAFDAGVGASPRLPPPKQELIPTVNVAKARGWPAGATPRAALGLTVTPFAQGLDHPRWIYVLPNGDVLVAESNAPPKPQGAKSIKGWVMKLVMQYAGAGTPSANRITLLRDADGDGLAETRSVLLEGLHSPFGMALVGERLYVANTDAVVSFPYVAGQLRSDAAPTKLVDLPAGAINHHWTKNVIASPDGRQLYVTVGSNSNVAENGMAHELGRAATWCPTI